MGTIVKYRPFTIAVQHSGNDYQGRVTPITHSHNGCNFPSEFSVVLNGKFRGIFSLENSKWQSTSLEDDLLVNEVAKMIICYYG